MPANWKALFKFSRLKQNLADGMEFEAAAKKAGYSQTTIDRKREELEGRAANPGLTQRELRRRLVYVQEWSPVSGKTFTSPAPAVEVKPAKPAEKPFVPEKFEHPALGEGRRSASGGFLPLWASDEYSGGSINLGNLPTPGARSESAWAKFYAGQARFARSYQTNRDTPPPPPMIYHDEPEEIPQRGFKDEGRDVSAEALNGRFGFARIPLRGE